MTRELVEKNAELITGMSVDALRDISPEKFRQYCEEKNGKGFIFVSEFPSVGRGNVLRDGIITRDVLDAEIDRMLEI